MQRYSAFDDAKQKIDHDAAAQLVGNFAGNRLQRSARLRISNCRFVFCAYLFQSLEIETDGLQVADHLHKRGIAAIGELMEPGLLEHGIGNEITFLVYANAMPGGGKLEDMTARRFMRHPQRLSQGVDADGFERALGIVGGAGRHERRLVSLHQRQKDDAARKIAALRLRDHGRDGDNEVDHHPRHNALRKFLLFGHRHIVRALASSAY